MKNKYIGVAIILAVLIGAGGFFGGMSYQKTKTPQPGQFFSQGNRQEGQRRMGGMAQGQGMAPIAGEILSKDDSTITVKMQDGSSKIVIFSNTTPVNKTSEGSLDDLKAGEVITAFGKQNQDGSITAESISLGGNTFFIRGENPPKGNNGQQSVGTGQ